MTKRNRKHKKHINETETFLKQQLKKEVYEEKKNTITPNETAIKKLLQQCKFKMFTCLKYKTKSAVKTVVDNNEGSKTIEEKT